MNVTPLQQITADQNFRAIIYGPAGSKKTTLAATFPKPMLFLDFDQKLEPIQSVQGIDVIQYMVKDVSDCMKVFGQFLKDFREAKKTTHYKTLVVDSLTSLDTLCVRYFVALSGKDPASTATLPIYGDVSGWYTFFLTELKAITQCHVVVIAHEHYNIDEDSSVHSIQPLITGSKVLNKIPAMFKEVWYMTKKDDVATLWYKPQKKAIANSLVLHLGTGGIENPTYDKVVAAMQKERQ